MLHRTFMIESDNQDTQNLELQCDVVEQKLLKDAIMENKIQVIGQLSNSSNGALLGEITLEDQKFSVIIKPSMYENPLIDFEWGTLSKREVAAYELSSLLAWNIVPMTVLRDVENLECSVQLFIPHDPRQHYFSLTKFYKEDMERFAVFDYLINNADRKAGHILAEENESFILKLQSTQDESILDPISNKNLFGIDHGLSFNVEEKLRTVIWEFSEQQISQHLLVDISNSFNSIERILKPFLNKHEIEKTILRAEQLLMNPYHKALDGNSRAFPWPLV